MGRAKNIAIKTTSVVLGTGYVLGKMFASGCKNLEAKIVTKIDDNYTEQEVRSHRMKSYYKVMSEVDKKVHEAQKRADEISKILKQKFVTNQITLMDQDSINPNLQKT